MACAQPSGRREHDTCEGWEKDATVRSSESKVSRAPHLARDVGGQAPVQSLAGHLKKCHLSPGTMESHGTNLSRVGERVTDQVNLTVRERIQRRASGEWMQNNTGMLSLWTPNWRPGRGQPVMVDFYQFEMPRSWILDICHRFTGKGKTMKPLSFSPVLSEP